MSVAIFTPLVIMIVLKFVGAILVRLVLNSVYKKDFINE